jgi:amino acid adenylation domain-containing protein
MTLLAAFQTLLHRYTGQNDIVVGSPIAGRTRVEVEGLIGFFVNTLVLRNDLSGSPTFRELLARVRKNALDAYTHQEVPFEKLVEELQPERDLGRNPFFQVMFQLRNYPTQSVSLGDLNIEEYEFDSDIAKFDLSVGLRDDVTGLAGSVEYRTDLFDPTTIERMIGHFQSLLEGIAANPEQRISEWNNTKTDYPKGKCIHQLFEEQVERTPDAVAVVFEDQQLTYRELNNRANRLAHYLQTLGIGPEALVGICVERSIEMVVGLLGILKAGGAYVPFDPRSPTERLQFQLQEMQAPVLLTQDKLVQSFQQSEFSHRCSVVCLDRDWQAIQCEYPDKPRTQARSNNLAYVIYTSGSTGQPKGVQITHESLLNLVFWHHRAFSVTFVDRATQLAGPGFDAAVWELWPYLTVGASIHIPDETTRLDAASLRDWLVAQFITMSFVPTALAESLMTLEWPRETALRILLTGADKLRTYPPETLPFRVFNNYGPTECTVVATSGQVAPNAHPVRAPTIGRPIANTRVYILDPHLNPVPIGAVGELHIGGVGLARGYLNRPELTEEKFISNPFSEEPGSRLYKTGDRACYLPDGNIEFLGRMDDQVKIRGYRIELGEIETVLGQHSSLREAVVLAREDSPGDRRLVAYVVAAAGCAPSVNELRSFLQQKLPEYMVPSAVVVLDSLPLTPNGKLDRNALPAPHRSRPEPDETFVAARTPVEETLASIWAAVLKVDKVGIFDNFFHLGGHSLLATQVHSRIRLAFQFDIPLRSLFENPTVASLATHIAGVQNEAPREQTLPISVSRQKSFPLSFAQQRLWFLDRLEPGSATYNVPAAFRLAGDLKVQALEQSLDEIVRRHEVLRTIFPTINGDPVQRILPSSSFSLTHADIGDRPASERDQVLSELLREEAERPFDLSRGPLMRAKLLRLAPQDHVLFLNMHHIISDGWSMGVLFRELSALYRAYYAGKPSPLPALPIQYADYSVWQRDWLHDENLASQLSYWTKQLDNLSTLQLPTDRARPAVQTYRGSSQIVDLSAQLTEAIKAIGQQEGVTLFMTLLAAFELLLSRYCGQSDIAVGSPIAGRTRQETEGLIGFFANTLVLRADLSNNPTFNELLRQVRETTLEAYSHQDLPFEKLVEELHPDRNLSKSPLFQVMFVFQNTADQPLEFDRLTVDPIPIITHSAKFELLLSLSDKDGKLGGSLNYNTDLFDAATIERMIGHFQTLLERIAANPERPISELPLLTESEGQRLLVEWNDTRTDYPKDRRIHELFENQVEKTPDAIALVCEDQQLTYRELNNRANQLAHYLQKLGVGPDVPVGICLERSVELAIGLLAVLKAGGVYVPLDPTYPPDRLALMLQDTQAPLIVSVQSLADQLSSHGAQSIILETTQQDIAREDHSNPRLAIATDSPAYVLYTSGSTGKPKGVVMGHGALANLISWQVESFSAPWPARTLQFAPLGFDVSIQEMLATWCSGGSLFLIKDELRRDGLRLLQYLREQSVERIFLPFIALQHLADAAADGNFFPLSLREIITAGEQLQLTESLRSFLNRLGDCCLRNQYGPTESHVVTEYTLKPPFERWPDLPPIGRPIANAEIYILDSDLNVVPIGVAGGIYIGGMGVARGYLNRPELTAEKFIPDPFSSDPTSRLYKTGDRARYLPDGNIEFLGRMDDQIKIRGYRVELGEIETVLGQHSSLREAVVLAREDSPGDRRLVAYAVAAAGSTPSVHELRSFLQQKLPEYMVPSAFVFLELLPLTPNGKLDRKALPAPDQTRPELEETFVAPRTPVEETLASIWAAVLKVDKVGIHDNFFELGGHSLLATQLISRIRETFKIDLPLRSLFEAPTIYGLAQRMQELGEKQEVRPETKITRVAREQYRVQQTK